jgi:D-3-phosphoglycerate dehydrogenase / 2-oxoglutarate reductase
MVHHQKTREAIAAVAFDSRGLTMKIVITDHRFPNVDQERRAVEAAGWELVVGQVTGESAVAELCRDADGVLAVRAPISQRVISAMERCRIIVRYGIGVETVDIPAATARGIMVANVPDYCVDEVSDHALTLLLMMSRQIIPALTLSKGTRWSMGSMPALHRLRGQTCGLFGAGKIGSALAAKASHLGMQVIASDPYLDDHLAREMRMEKVSLDTLLASSDFISIHAPLMPDTHHIFGERSFSKMKSTAFLINTARGGLIDEVALIAAIDSGKIAGAALDVLESETESTPLRAALVQHPKIIVTPHSAWFSDEARATLQARAIEQVLVCLHGERPYGLINRTVITTLAQESRS